MDRRIARFALIVVTIASVSLALFATKPCPPEPCRPKGGEIDEEQCTAAATWVASGAIEKVEHHRAGHPMNKDFAEFTFVPDSWHKGEQPVKSIRFRVGWCDNRRELPSDTSSRFRFFGKEKLDEKNPQYLDFEQVAENK
jgi:hypothetical protein